MEPASQSSKLSLSPLANLATTAIVSRFGMSNIYYGFILEIITSAFNYNYSAMDTSVIGNYNEYSSYAYLVAVSLILYYFCKYFPESTKDYIKEKTVNRFRRKTVFAKIVDPKELNSFKKYYELNYDIFLDKKDITFGDLDLTSGASIMEARNTNSWNIYKDTGVNITTTKLNQTFDFYDTNFDVAGSCTWRKETKAIKSNQSNNNGANGNNNTNTFSLPISEWIYIYPEIVIYVDESKLDLFTYFDKIKEFLVSYDKRNLVLKYVKYFSKKENTNEYHEVIFYSGPNLSLEEKEEKFIKPFFHNNNSKTIWETLKKVHYNPEFFSNMGQNARSNLLLYGPPGSGKSSFIYRVAKSLNRHIISVDISTITSKYLLYSTIQKPRVGSNDPKDAIIVLEEFDIMVNKLYKSEQDNKDPERMEKRVLAALSSASKDPSDVSFKENLVKGNSDDIVLRDLLDILQGTIPIDGSIIIATTNKYEEIKDLCPELFRAGRMTPIFFGYLDREGFKGFCKYYFDKYPSVALCDNLFNDVRPLTKTSEFVEKAMQFKAAFDDSEEAFEKFHSYFISY
jgi:hypothetical protein